MGLAAVGALLILAAPTERAQAMSLSNPGAAVVVQDNSEGDDDPDKYSSSIAMAIFAIRR